MFFENGDVFLLDWLFNPSMGVSGGNGILKNDTGSVKQNIRDLGMLIA